MRKQLSLNDYLDGFKNHDRTILARAITLIESQNPDHQKLAQELLKSLLPLAGRAKRIGISGTPGVGKSTFIEAFGRLLTQTKKRVAVLAVDPTSQVSGGSILGDKTRMTELSQDEFAYIRPTPSGETLGGVARKTRETIFLCEAFGFEYVLVETVGVGQSETTVSQMVDLFMMLLQPGSGDSLQGIKRGILEVVDMVIITKDDGDQELNIQKAKHDYEMGLQILRHETNIPPVFSCSSLTKKGLDDIEKYISNYFSNNKEQIQSKRKIQNIHWMWQLINDELIDSFKTSVDEAKINKMENDISLGKETSLGAAKKLLKEYFK